MFQEVLPSDIEHGIGTIHTDDSCLRVTFCKSEGDIGGATSKIYNLLAVKRRKLIREMSYEFRVWL